MILMVFLFLLPTCGPSYGPKKCRLLCRDIFSRMRLFGQLPLDVGQDRLRVHVGHVPEAGQKDIELVDGQSQVDSIHALLMVG